MGSLADANAGEGIIAPEGATTSAKGEYGSKDDNEMRPG
jgi:hypothetical protein